MKCIYNDNLIVKNSLSHSTLKGRNEDGLITDVMKLSDGGYKSILTVNESGFTLIAVGSKEILRRGTDKNVFTIYDSLLINVKPLLVKDEVRGVELAYTDYENKYGFNRVERTVPAKYYLYSVPTEGAMAFGAIEKHAGYTLALHSVYVPKEMTKQESVDYIASYIFDQLAANEKGNVTAYDLPQYFEIPGVRVYSHGYAARLETSEELYWDAIERKSTVSEVLMTRQEAEKAAKEQEQLAKEKKIAKEQAKETEKTQAKG